MYSDKKSPFTQWWDSNMQQIAASPDVRELIAMAFEGGMQVKKPWVGLTQDNIDKAWEWSQKSSQYGVTRIETFALAIEAKLKERNV